MRHYLTGGCLLFIVQQCAMAQAPVDVKSPDTEKRQIVIAVPSAPAFMPMSQSERLHYYLKNTFSPTSVLASAAGAGISQWRDSPREWPQGAEGYGLRVGNAYAKYVMRQTMMYGSSSLLHEDNRYIQSGKSGFGARLKYAIESTLLARRDDGSRRLSYSRIGSTAGTSFVSLVWMPPSANQMSDAWSGFAISMGSQVGFNVAREFVHRPKSKTLKSFSGK